MITTDRVMRLLTNNKTRYFSFKKDTILATPHGITFSIFFQLLCQDLNLYSTTLLQNRRLDKKTKIKERNKLMAVHEELDKAIVIFKKHKKVILKPIHSFSGNDIHLLNKFDPKLIKKFIKQHDHIMCQKYLPKISRGDKRVFLINGKVCGAISRVPKKGSFLSNMSKGAKPINIKLTKLEYRISKLIAKDLKKEDIYFAGIDFIDQKLNGDINVTSPTGLKTLFDLSGINLAKIFWNELKA